MTARGLSLPLLALATWAGCGSARRTEVVVEVKSDLAIPAELDAVTLRIERAGRAAETRSFPLGSGQHELPLVVGLLAPAGNATAEITVAAAGLKGPTAVVREQATIRFVEGQSLRLPLDLSRARVAPAPPDGAVPDAADGPRPDAATGARPDAPTPDQDGPALPSDAGATPDVPGPDARRDARKVDIPCPVTSTGFGVYAEYFRGKGPFYYSMYPNEPPGTLAATGNERRVDMGWGTSSPSMVPADFAARFTARITPKYSETYTFTVVADDFAHVWIDGQLVAMNGTSTPVALQAGHRHDLTVDFLDVADGASVRLSWRSPSQPMGIVPHAALSFPCDSVSRCRPESEACNGVDDDCDGFIDEAVCSFTTYHAPAQGPADPMPLRDHAYAWDNKLLTRSEAIALCNENGYRLANLDETDEVALLRNYVASAIAVYWVTSGATGDQCQILRYDNAPAGKVEPVPCTGPGRYGVICEMPGI